MNIEAQFDAGLCGCFGLSRQVRTNFQNVTKIGAAISGGGDSIALLHLLDGWCEDKGYGLEAVSVDHGLRPEARAEAEFAGTVAQGLGRGHEILFWGGYSGRGNLQDCARKARYKLMAAWARENGISHVALGHTADDQFETFMMRLGRSAGVDGLAGMSPVRVVDGVAFIRPMLGMGRDELREYLCRRKQGWIDDPSNENEEFDRIKIRKARGALEALGFSSRTIVQVAQNMADAKEALNASVLDLAKSSVHFEYGDLLIAREAFLAAPFEIQRRLLIKAMHWISSQRYSPRAQKLQILLDAIADKKSGVLQGVRLLPKGEYVRMVRECNAVKDHIAQIGELWDGRWILRWDGQSDDNIHVRALGDKGLKQIEDRRLYLVPHASLKASPALFEGDRLLAAPLAQFGKAALKLQKDERNFFTSLLSH